MNALNFKTWNLFEKIWLFGFTSIGILLSFMWHENTIGFIAFLSGIVCVIMVAKGSIWNYLFGFVNVLSYAYVSYCNQLYGEVQLNLIFYLPIQFIGFAMWKNHIASENKEIKAKKLKPLVTILLIVATLILTYFYKQFLISIGGSQTFLDGFTTIVSITAQILMILRFREQWILWIIVNISSIIMWALVGDILMVTMWSAYLINAMYGYWKWSKKAKGEIENV